MEASATRQVAYNTIVQIVARAITTAISLLAIAYLSRYLGVAGYGQYGLIFAYLSLFGIVVDFGFFLLQVRETTRRPDQESFILGNVLGLKLALGAVVFVVAYGVARLLYDNPVIYTGILIGALSQWALTLHQVPVSLFQTRLQMHKVAIVNVAARVAYLAAILWSIQAQVGLLGIIGLVAVLNIGAWLVQQLWASQIANIAPRWDTEYWWEFIKEAWPLGVAVVLAVIYFRVDTVMLQAIKGDYAVGIYSLPYKVIEVALTVPTIFMSSVVPVFTRFWEHQRERAHQTFRKAFDAMVLIGWPLAVGVMVISTQLMVLIGGSDFVDSGAVLKILIWATFISFMGGVFNYSIIAAGHQRLMVWPYLAATLFNIVTNLIFMPRYSYIGAAYTTVATELLVILYIAWLARRRLGLVPDIRVFGKAMLSSGVMVAVLWWTGVESLWWAVALGAAVYGVMIVATKAVNQDIVREIVRFK